MLAPIAWRMPPPYDLWERVVSLLFEGLVASGVEVTLFATRDAETSATLDAIVRSPTSSTTTTSSCRSNPDSRGLNCERLGHDVHPRR